MKTLLAVLVASILAIGHAQAWVHGGAYVRMVTCAGVDDSTAINAALDAAITAQQAGHSAGIYIPSGVCVYKTPHALMTRPISIYGDGSLRTIIKLDTALTGDAFSWSETWLMSNFPGGSSNTVVSLTDIRPGVHVEGIGIIGDRSVSQNAFMFYNRNDYIYFRDVQVMYVKGTGIGIGETGAVAQAYTRESQFYAITMAYVGDTNKPGFQITASGTGTGGSEIDIFGLSAWSIRGAPGLAIWHSANSNMRDIRVSNLRLEGSGTNAEATDLFQIGNSAFAGELSQVLVTNMRIVVPQAGQYGLRVDGQAGSARPYEITVAGTIGAGSGTGGGLIIAAGRDLTFDMRGITSTGTDVTVGSSATVGAKIVINGYGEEGTWTTSIDPSVAADVLFKPTLEAFP